MEFLLVIVASYLIGSIPNGLIIGQTFYKTDLRQFGSKNIGATNAYRTLGPGPAFWVFLSDALKGVVGVLIGQYIGGSALAEVAGGIGAIAGHNWSVFLKFKGGRGVATGLGVVAMLSPKVTLIVFIIWAFIVYFTRYVSLASIVAAAFVPITMWILNARQEFYYFGMLAALFVIARHRPNIERLLAGTEAKIKAGGKPETGSPKEK
ncbi:glycerol-3-phosphate 1-O-acyltransferase PlsY [Sporomusa acidovorans]|uniref:Glycerol-3-phosphate acyltransferase n=1 Tax=Sporomusa acidovorans (strain ATCC 49682 / DSM 3132 / Mol) TaxID=1123286 RepID=A0ABZ3J405_SPOA4|nr:glycerol-3-phosphate 1-O-acyltransferase PlsY [Sporomusa acidovorans]OZC20300.1 glycerol-3-phosphate acyltransferase [Sporomusa acidovorans DSM 3132]SDD38720.1 glycerol-3-phosphate acyltransferase PlsY [Sporomusa acidovorans]